MDVGGSVQHMSAATELKPEPEPEVALRALNAEATKLRKRHDEITAECITLRQKLHQMVERTSGFTKSADLSAGANEDAAEVAELEAELADVEAEIDVANHDHSTYGLMIERIRSEEKTYRRDLNEIDFQSSAKQADAKKLYLMLKELKRLCGSGGAIKEGVVEVQGDHCDAVLRELVARGIQAKRAGG